MYKKHIKTYLIFHIYDHEEETSFQIVSKSKFMSWLNTHADKYGESTKYDLDYGKLLIIALCIYIALEV